MCVTCPHWLPSWIRPTWTEGYGIPTFHSDDRPPLTSRQDAAKLCNGFCRFFTDKLKIADTVTARLSTTSAYHRQPVHMDDHACLLDELAAATVDEVAKVIRSLYPPSRL